MTPTPTGPASTSEIDGHLTSGSASGSGAASTVTADVSGGGSARPRRRGRKLAWLGVLGGALLLGGCTYPTYGADPGATNQGHDIFKMYSGMMTTGIIVGGIVMLLMIWTILRYRRRSDTMPRQFHEHLGIEAMYTIIPIVIVGVLFFFTVLTENNVDRTVPARVTAAQGKPVVDITVTAFQWGWRFDYPNLNVGVGGELTEGPNDHGPQMVVPQGEDVQITLVSNDVIHGFYVRDFNFSRYAQPGVTNVFDLNVNRLGTFDGQCTQFCGLYHSDMLFSVRSVTPAQFRAWATTEVANGHTIQALGSGYAATAPKSSPDVRACASGACPKADGAPESSSKERAAA